MASVVSDITMLREDGATAEHFRGAGTAYGENSKALAEPLHLHLPV
jgi:hypothetical protein